jgi:hypothetical protein
MDGYNMAGTKRGRGVIIIILQKKTDRETTKEEAVEG